MVYVAEERLVWATENLRSTSIPRQILGVNHPPLLACGSFGCGRQHATSAGGVGYLTTTDNGSFLEIDQLWCRSYRRFIMFNRILGLLRNSTATAVLNPTPVEKAQAALAQLYVNANELGWDAFGWPPNMVALEARLLKVIEDNKR
jgi:hypothetical protein